MIMKSVIIAAASSFFLVGFFGLQIYAKAQSIDRPSPIIVHADSNKADWQDDLQRIFDKAAKSGRPVRLQSGTFRHSDLLTLHGIDVSGEGASTVLEGTTPNKSAVVLTDSGAKLSNMKLVFKATGRSAYDESALVLARGAQNFTIGNLTMDGSDSVGIFVQGSSKGTIENNDISNTLADSIHITGGSSDITVRNNTTHNSGDDGIAVVSYEKNGKRVEHVTVYDNSVLYNKYARGISVVGGEDVDIHDNTIACDKGYAGIYIASEEVFHTYGVSNVKVTHNAIKGCGGKKIWHGAVMIYTGYHLNDHITVSNNAITDSPFVGIIVLGHENHAITLKDNAILRSGDTAILQSDVTEPAVESGNITQ